jgi:hypothetical protein
MYNYIVDYHEGCKRIAGIPVPRVRGRQQKVRFIVA